MKISTKKNQILVLVLLCNIILMNYLLFTEAKTTGKGDVITVIELEADAQEKFQNNDCTFTELYGERAIDSNEATYAEIKSAIKTPWGFGGHEDVFIETDIVVRVEVPEEYLVETSTTAKLMFIVANQFADYEDLNPEYVEIRIKNRFTDHDITVFRQEHGEGGQSTSNDETFHEYSNCGNNGKVTISPYLDGKYRVIIEDLMDQLTLNSATHKYEGSFELEIYSKNFESKTWRTDIWQRLYVYEVETVFQFHPNVAAYQQTCDYGVDAKIQNTINYPAINPIFYKITDSDNNILYEYSSSNYIATSTSLAPYNYQGSLNIDLGKLDPGYYKYNIFASDSTSGTNAGSNIAEIWVKNDIPIVQTTIPDYLDYCSEYNTINLNILDNYMPNPTYTLKYGTNINNLDQLIDGTWSVGDNGINIDEIASYSTGNIYYEIIVHDGYDGIESLDDEGIWTLEADDNQYIPVIDSTAPVVMFDNSAWSRYSTTPTISARVRDFNIITSCTLTIEGNSFDMEQVSLIEIQNLNEYHFSIDDDNAQFYSLWDGLDDGDYSIRVDAYDGSTNQGWNEIAISKDATGPIIQPYFPTIWGAMPDNLYCDINDPSGVVYGALLLLENGDYYEMVPDSSIPDRYWMRFADTPSYGDFLYDYQTLSEGTHIISIKAIDSLDNVKIDQSNSFIKDSINPYLSDISYPEKSKETPEIMMSFTEINGISVNLVDGEEETQLAQKSSVNPTVTIDIPLNIWNGLDDGNNILQFKVYDSASNLLEFNVEINKDTTAPDMTFTFLFEDSLNETAPSFINEFPSGYESIFGSLYYEEFSGAFDTVNGLCYMDQTFWNNVPYGSNELSIILEDNLGNSIEHLITLVKHDTIAPEITIIQPELDQNVHSSSFYFQISIFDENIGDISGDLLNDYTITYSINDNTPIVAEDTSGFVEQAYWDLMLTRQCIFTISVTDAEGNMAMATTNVTRTDYLGPDQRSGEIDVTLFYDMPYQMVLIIVGSIAVSFCITYFISKKKRSEK